MVKLYEVMKGTQMDNVKEVYFDVYCPKCKYYDLDGIFDPCNECLEIGGRESSHKPEYFVEKED